MSFWTAFKNSTILQAVLTIMIWASIIYLVVTGQTVPPELNLAGTAVLGFYFGSKVQQMVNNRSS